MATAIQILDVRTDDTDHARAKQNAADELVKYPDLAAEVGIWSYNGPAIVSAVQDAKKVGQVKIVCFDQEQGTLDGIKSGAVFATVVQQPYVFGHDGLKMLAKLVAGDKSVIPANGTDYIPTQVVDKSNVDKYQIELNKQEGSGTTPPAAKATGNQIQLAYVTNNPSDYWNIVRKGVEDENKELPNVNVQFVMPADGTAATQKSEVDDLVAKGVKGIAISPVDPANQTDWLNTVAAKTTLITMDSDAASSKRVFYIGTDNHAAGVMTGEQIKKALPQGGKIVLFVGKADAQNAHDRIQGIRDALSGKT